MCDTIEMRSISQRELRNQSAEILRGLLRGESYRLTNRGKPVGAVVPLSATPYEELLLRPGTQDMSFDSRPAITRDENVSDVLNDLRGER